MMTLEGAIAQCEINTKEFRSGWLYALKRGETIYAERCKKSMDEFGQLAEWLKELAERRKLPEIIHCGECKHYKIDHPKANGYHCCYRCHNIFPMKETDFCSKVERRTDGSD